MTHSEFATLISGMGYDNAYDFFKDDTEHEPPFICFLYGSRIDLTADNSNYQYIERARIEFYSRERDFDAEKAIGEALNNAGLVYSIYSEFLDDEEMQMTVFETSYVLTEEEENASEQQN